jgi:hypothetical protein
MGPDHEPSDLMAFLILKNQLINQGYEYVGDSSIDPSSDSFDVEIIKRTNRDRDAEWVTSQAFLDDSLRAGAKRDQIAPGVLAYFVRGSESVDTLRYLDDELDYEDLPDTQPTGSYPEIKDRNRMGLIAIPNTNLVEVVADSASNLIFELSYERRDVLMENVKAWYIQPDLGEGDSRVELSKFDIITLKQMEDDKILDLPEMRYRKGEFDRKCTKSLGDTLIPNNLVVNLGSERFTLNGRSTFAEYIAIVDENDIIDY